MCEASRGRDLLPLFKSFANTVLQYHNRMRIRRLCGVAQSETCSRVYSAGHLVVNFIVHCHRVLCR